MAIQLSDDGTLDTVIKCTGCGQEFRFNYDPAGDDYPIGDEARDAYDEFVDDCIAGVKAEHVCGEEE